ncbi:WSC-domain-containing protein [Lentinus tigrinus ALCF2SS1-6]|uniref:WSC-domain-containing protein n=2 Tax=Lentinus tigrinus TaxID=5365 RepID=A0A5C2SUD9_9APHY|nr:WSC-domain-containing protein [Lentinus tigrinus ALCF2SS1-6]
MRFTPLTLIALALPVYVYSFDPPTLPFGWTTWYACVVDNPSRVIVDDVITQSSNNTPAACIEHCDAQLYLWAGVEYSNECHCGIGLQPLGPPPQAPVSECDLPCSGDPNLACGGSWRIQIYLCTGLPRCGA